MSYEYDELPQLAEMMNDQERFARTQPRPDWSVYDYSIAVVLVALGSCCLVLLRAFFRR